MQRSSQLEVIFVLRISIVLYKCNYLWLLVLSPLSFYKFLESKYPISPPVYFLPQLQAVAHGGSSIIAFWINIKMKVSFHWCIQRYTEVLPIVLNQGFKKENSNLLHILHKLTWSSLHGLSWSYQTLQLHSVASPSSLIMPLLY